jgi:hypothetical protein
LSSLEGLSFMEGGSKGRNESTIQFMSSLKDANFAIDGLTYICDSNIHSCKLSSSTTSTSLSNGGGGGGGGDVITVHVDDNGFTGRGGALSAYNTIHVLLFKNEHEDDDNDVTISYDEYYKSYENSEISNEDEEDDDGSELVDGLYQHSLGKTDNVQDSTSAAAVASDVYPLGDLSWHDVNYNYESTGESQQVERIGDADFWDE